MSVQHGDRIEMSQRERDRLKVLHGVRQGKYTRSKAAQLLSLTVRQVRRLLQRLADEGDGGLVHRLRDRPSNRRCAGKRKQRLLREYRQRFSGFGPTFACEKLAEMALHVASDTLRRWLVEVRLEGALAIRFRDRYLNYHEVVAWDALLGGSALPTPRSLAQERPTPEEKDKKDGASVSEAPSPGVQPTAARSGRTSAEPYPPDGKKKARKKGPWRPAADHPWRKGFATAR